jgi:hypothetical protein
LEPAGEGGEQRADDEKGDGDFEESHPEFLDTRT